MTLKEISERMEASGTDAEPTTINQRIIRDGGEHFISGEGKPKQIELNIDSLDITFYRYRNRCQICAKTVPPDELLLRDVDRAQEGIPKKWANRIACCKACKNVPWEDSKLNEKAIPKEPEDEAAENNEVGQPQWEYLRVSIRQNKRQAQFPSKLVIISQWASVQPENDVYYYEFKNHDEKEWHYLVDTKGKIISNTVVDVLNDYGDEGWELVQIHPINRSQITIQAPYPGFYPISGGFFEEFDCIFKRQKDGD